MTEAEWVSVTDAAALLGKSERTIRRMMARGRLTVDRTGPVILVDIAGHMTGEGDEQARKHDRAPDMAAILAENDRLRMLVEELRGERDYLRQALAREQSVTMSLTTGPKQIEGPDKRRSWWQFWRTTPDT